MAAASHLIAHLKYCRQRAGFLGVLGLAALLAWRALPGTGPSKSMLEQAYTAGQAFLLQKSDLATIRDDLARWVPRVPREPMERASYAVSRAGSAVEQIGLPANTASFFIIPPRISPLLQAAESLSQRPLSPDPGVWTRAQLADIAALIGPRNPTPSATETADLLTTRREFERARADPRGAAAAQQGLDALGAFEIAASELDRAPPPSNLALAEQAKRLAELMQTLGMTEFAPLQRAGEARAVTQALRDGSLSVLGFTVPGLVVRLLVPLLACGIAFDLLIGASRARDFARRELAPDQTALILAGFPWGATHPDEVARSGTRRAARLALACLPLLASLAAILPLTLAGDARTALAGSALLILAACAAITAVICVDGAELQSQPAPAAGEGAELRLDLAKEQLEAVNAAVALILLASVTVLSFFLAFLLVPSELLFQGDRTAALQTVRNEFDRAYVQRLRDQAQTYVDWSNAPDRKSWAQFGFAADAVPAGHPAASVLKALWEQPIVRAEMSATERVKDLVSESRALLPDLDQQDLENIREILYRDNFAPVVALLGELQRIHASTPLPQDALDRLPDGVKNPPIAGMTVPFLFPYRTMVERGGFADRLAPLPGDERVQAWLDFMKANGLERVRGFDALAGALADLSAEVGKTKFKIAGIEVQRTVAGDAALIALALLTIGLAARLRDARAYLRTLAPPEGAFAIRRTPGILFVHDARLPRTLEAVLAVACCALPAIAAVIVLYVPSDPPMHPAIGPTLLVLICAAVAAITLERKRLVAAMDDGPALPSPTEPSRCILASSPAGGGAAGLAATRESAT